MRLGQSLNADRFDFNVTGYDLIAATVLTLTGAGGTNYNLAAGVTATIGSKVTLQSSGASQNWNINGGTQTITLFNYTNKSGSGEPSIGTLPAGMFVLSGPTDTGSSIQIEVLIANQLTWSKGDGDWDASTSNWNSNAATYLEPAIVTFPDLAYTGNTTINTGAALTVTNTAN